MRHLFFMSALMWAFCSTAVGSDDPAKGSAAPKTAVVEEKADENLKPINTSNPRGVSPENDYGVNRERPMEQWETYDQNTGLPDMTPSDSSYELQ